MPFLGTFTPILVNTFMGNKVLITGGSGLVGSELSSALEKRGYTVCHLSRYKNRNSKYNIYTWDIGRRFIEPDAFEGVEYIIHLAGAGVAEKRWTSSRKKILTSSRIDSASLLYNELKRRGGRLKAFISASAIGIYGFDTGDNLLSEDQSETGSDFLANLTKSWEAAADKFQDVADRIVKLRIGLVLSKNGGLLEKFIPPAKLGLSTAFGDGQQYMSWIHINDLVKMLISAIENKNMGGVYNAVAPNPVTNTVFVKTLSKILHRPYFLPNTPDFLIKIAFGELASVITGGNKVSSEKIERTGFKFSYPELENALADLL